MLRYVRGTAILLGFLILFLLGIVFLAIVQLVIEITLLIVGIAFLIIALVLLPHYLGKKKKVKSKHYSVKKVKG